MNFDVLVNKKVFKGFVESERNPGTFYKIETNEDGFFTCICKSFKYKICECKHIKAAVEELGL